MNINKLKCLFYFASCLMMYFFLNNAYFIYLFSLINSIALLNIFLSKHDSKLFYLLSFLLVYVYIYRYVQFIFVTY